MNIFFTRTGGIVTALLLCASFGLSAADVPQQLSIKDVINVYPKESTLQVTIPGGEKVQVTNGQTAAINQIINPGEHVIFDINETSSSRQQYDLWIEENEVILAEMKPTGSMWQIKRQTRYPLKAYNAILYQSSGFGLLPAR